MEVLKLIKAKDPDIQVILLTGQGSDKDGVEGMRLGAFDYLVKPLDIEELITKMKEAAGGP
jgi:DNA-binding response OmpR family regulator